MDISKINKDKKVRNYSEKKKKQLEKKIKEGSYNDALIIISSLARLNYDFNQVYYDETLETYLQYLSKKMIIKDYIPKKERVLFFDSFGFNTRGLAQIYLKGLVKKYHVTYVTYIQKQKDIPDLEKIVNEGGGNITYIKEKKYVNQCQELIRILESNQIKTFILYSKPEDVVPVVVLMAADNILDRIQINLTDHAFWLGATAIDKCLEFREYGIYISHRYRNIEMSKLYYLPFYPEEIFEKEFQGYPFNMEEHKCRKLCFSGGSLYKTIGGNNAYYEFVDYLLRKYEDLIFWYAGNKDEYGYQLENLKEKYPGKVYWTEERTDLLEILKRSDIYLNTYPIGGGLMIQYAVLAGTIPIMIKYDDNSSGVLKQQDSLLVFHKTFEEAKTTIEKIFNEEGYKEIIMDNLRNTVPNREEFENELFRIVSGEAHPYQKKISAMDISNQKKIYYDNFICKYLDRYFIKKKNVGFLMRNPLIFIVGIWGYFKSRKIDEIKNV